MNVDPLQDVGPLTEALLATSPGAVLSVAQPNTLFDATLNAIDWPRQPVFRHLSKGCMSALNDLGLGLSRGMLHGLGYQTTLMSDKPHWAVGASEVWTFRSLDSCYLNLTYCSAIHISCPDARDILTGAKNLIRKHAPVLFIASHLNDSLHNFREIVFLLKTLCYVPFSGRRVLKSPVEERGNYLIAFPAPIEHDLEWEYAISGDQKPLRALLCGWRGPLDSIRARLERWSLRVAAPDLVTSGMHPVPDNHEGQTRWTGPFKNSAFALFLPSWGSYTISLEISEFAFEDTLGLGQLRIDNVASGVTIWSDSGKHRLEATYEIRQDCLRWGAVIVTLVTAGLGWKSSTGGVQNVGVRLAAVHADRVATRR